MIAGQVYECIIMLFLLSTVPNSPLNSLATFPFIGLAITLTPSTRINSFCPRHFKVPDTGRYVTSESPANTIQLST
jgi:hypothetical protein